MRVLLIIDHAPDYREPFFRGLGEKVNLTVVSQPCECDGLTAPEKRYAYKYIEIPTKRFLGFSWQPGLGKLLNSAHWDVVCCDINLRQLARNFAFLTKRKFWNKWIWRGHVFGKNESEILDVIRKYMLQRSAGCLTYSDLIAQRVIKRYGIDAVSFNNTQVSKNEFRCGDIDNHEELRLLFVGRNQPRKKLHRLVELANRRCEVYVRLIGPGMESIDVPEKLEQSGRVKIFGRTIGKELNSHFDWADLVANPGHVGLLVMNAAKHGKGIVVDRDSQHAPEYLLALEAGQAFISFGHQNEVDQFIDDVLINKWKLQNWGQKLQDIAKKKYTVEYMTEVHYNFFVKKTKR